MAMQYGCGEWDSFAPNSVVTADDFTIAPMHGITDPGALAYY